MWCLERSKLLIKFLLLNEFKIKRITSIFLSLEWNSDECFRYPRKMKTTNFDTSLYKYLCTEHVISDC